MADATPLVDAVALAEFDIDKGSVCRVQYPHEVGDASLRRRLRENPGGAVASLTLSAMHPELMGWMCDRRDDVFNIAKLGGFSAFCDTAMLSVIVATFENLRRPCSKVGRRGWCDLRPLNETSGKYTNDPFMQITYQDPMLGFVIFVLRGMPASLVSRSRTVTAWPAAARRPRGWRR